MKLIKKYLPGAKVFAKVRGYPPWPARVEGVIEPNTKNAKYNVFFYGTGETAVCKVEELFLYEENKDKYGKHLKRKIFHEGLQQLERELNNDQGAQESVTPKEEASVEPAEEPKPVPEVPTVTAPAPPPAATAQDSDLETGPLVIDESDKKKTLKRKSVPARSLSQDSPEPKKKRGRAKSLYAPEITPKPDPNESITEESTKEVVSRSGRKIKPKRFADFSSSDEFDMELSGRGRGRSKVDESLEALPTPTVPKKRVSLDAEKKEEKKEKASPKEDLSQQKLKLRWLRMENQLLHLDAQITNSLGLHHADTEACLEAMDEMMVLPIEPLMLKKHPQVVDTVKRLRRYIGNVIDWKMSEDEVLAFKQKAEIIRQKGELISNKFETLFVIPEGQSFWSTFTELVTEFKEATKGMKQETIFALLVDPTETNRETGKSAQVEKISQVEETPMNIDEITSTSQTITSK